MNNKLILLVGVLGASVTANAALVDDFTTGAYTSAYINAGNEFANTSASGVPGGSRYTNLVVQSSVNGEDARVRVATSQGTFAVSNGPGVNSTVRLGYGFSSAAAAPGSNPLGLNLSTAPIIKINFRSNDLAQPVKASLYLANNTVLTRTVNAASSSSTFSTSLDFSADAASLGSVSAIVLDFDPSTDGDFAITNVSTVPEPASMAALGLGVAAMLRRRRASK
jgi:hypothetical protein